MYQFKELYTLDFSKVNYINEVHQIIKDELDFPDYYGMNWDAFWDCLTDMVGDPIHTVIIREIKFILYDLMDVVNMINF